MQHPRHGCQEGQVLCTTTRPTGQNDSQRPVPNPKAQGCVPLIHWGKPQHETAELGGNKQILPSSRETIWELNVLPLILDLNTLGMTNTPLCCDLSVLVG
ncbi:hypothetical protein ILYODFUR_002312 [Ilyodon furcidens]|uniref:Uncharacterized protein n=1 Tax=Ilyodon furcidens TaxID=33524 RepID=A0ABV0U208_9TELE